MLKQSVQQGRNERRARRTLRYVELLSEARNAAGGLFQQPVIECLPGVAATAHISRSDRHPRSDAFDLRHVAELPMVRPDAVGRRQWKA